jgi:folate-dependent phosphoribosylglycinamide formyltransferase PurN
MFARHAVDGAAWKASHLALLLQQSFDRQRNFRRRYVDRDHLLAAAGWLRRAQSATGDGGVSGRYRLLGGWSSSYPETTGYIVPTFIALARELADPDYLEAARQAIGFLVSVQLPSGAFPGMERAENSTTPSTFNTAQIVHGLMSWHAATRDPAALDAARRAGDWLVSVQDEDGAFRRHCYLDVATTYSAHASCWLADLGQYLDEGRFLTAAGRHLDWVLRQRDLDTGWIDLCGFDRADHAARRAFTHTIAYTLSGMLRTATVLRREDGIGAVRQAALALLRRLEISRWMPGVLNHRWQAVEPYACLTGNAQLALLWIELYELDRDPRYLNAAFKAIDIVKRAQPMASANPGIRGGIPGSDPIWGGYIYMAIPNWAAKFFVDALLAKAAARAALPRRPQGRWELPSDVPTEVPTVNTVPASPRPRVVMYTAETSTKVAQMVEHWSSWNFRPDCVVVEAAGVPPIRTRLRARVWEDGLRWVPGSLLHRAGARTRIAGAGSYPGAIDFCRRNGIPFVTVDSLADPANAEIVGRLKPDLAIHAGAGILRAPLLAVPTIGTINAHMGILPRYRGMNVAEWARFEGNPVGCSVHWIDAGIDTGAILCIRRVDTGACRSVVELREAVDRAQLALLGEVVRTIVQTGQPPPARKHGLSEGVQFFRMHPHLAEALDSELARGQ